MEQLNPADALFTHMETAGTPGQIAWLNIYDPATAREGKVSFEAVVHHVEQRLHMVRFFRQRLIFVPGKLGEPFWVDDSDFDLKYHVRHVGLPAPGDWRQLCILVAELFERPFDLSKPLWELSVINGLDNVAGLPKGSFALLAKMHHAAIDGVSGVDVTTNLHTPEPDTPPPVQPSQEWRPGGQPRPAELVLRSYLANVRNPGRRMRTIAGSIPGLRNLKAAVAAGEVRKTKRRKVPKTIFSGAPGPHRVMDARRFSLEAMKTIRELVPGSTVNDVVLAIVSGALRRYLHAKNELPQEPLIASCPISIRTKEQQGRLGNQVGNMFVELPTNVGDPVERLRRIKDETTNAKAMHKAVGARTLAELSQLVPGMLVGLGTRLSSQISAPGMANTTVTNVPGPQKPLFLAGAKIVTQFALAPLLPGLGIFHFVLSYCGEITLTALADREKLPDPGFYAECIQTAFEELLAAV